MRNTKPNAQCSECHKRIYRKPNEILKHNNIYCSRECFWLHKGYTSRGMFICKICNIEYKPLKRSSQYCSRTCSNKSRLNTRYSKDSNINLSTKRYLELKEKFNFTSCMVENCEYDKTYDIHRIVPGKDGGNNVLMNTLIPVVIIIC